MVQGAPNTKCRTKSARWGIKSSRHVTFQATVLLHQQCGYAWAYLSLPITGSGDVQTEV